MLIIVVESVKLHVEQCQVWSKIEMATQKLKTELNANIKECGSQCQIVMKTCDEKVFNDDVGKIDVEEFIVTCQPIEPKIMKDVEIDEMIL